MVETILHVNSTSFSKEVEDSEIPVIVDFHADWCGPCVSMAPVFEELSKEYRGRLKFAKIDVDSSQDIAVKYSVMSIPTLIFFNRGKEIERFIGFRGKDDLKSNIENTLKNVRG